MNLIFDPAHYFFNPFALPYAIVGTLTLLEGIYIYSQHRKALLNFTYMLSCFFVAAWLTGMGFELSCLHDPTALLWTKYYVFLGIIFLTPAIYSFSVSWQWTLTRREEKRQKIFVALNFFIGAVFYTLSITTDLFIQGLWHFTWGVYPRAGIVYGLFLAWFFILMTCLLTNFIKAYKRETDAIKKKQAKLMIIAFASAYFGSYEFLLNYGISTYLLAFVPVFICINIVGYSVIRYKLMDIETVIHKTFAWIMTSLIIVLPFVFLIMALRDRISTLSRMGAFLSLGGIFSLFFLFLSLFQPKVDHFFQRRRYNREEALNCFMDEVVHLKDISHLILLIRNTIIETLYTRDVNVYLYSEMKKKYVLAGISGSVPVFTATKELIDWVAGADSIAYKEFVDIDPRYAPIREDLKQYFSSVNVLLIVPLTLSGRLLGMITLGPKATLAPYTAFDLDFLKRLKNQSVIALSNSLLYERMDDQIRRRTDELGRVQKQLTQAEKLATVGTLAGGVAHEINNPLAAILTNAEMLLDSEEIRDESDRESLELIKEATKRCRTIVKKLMAYARKPLESAELHKVDLIDVIESVQAFIGYQLDQENIKVEVENSSSGEVCVVGKQNELEQVMTNIILNAKDAIKSAKKRGTIYIRINRRGDWAEIAVEDEGPGIAPEMIAKIFDPFFTTKEVGKGLGLGLAICQAAVERLGGDILVVSEKGKGTTFTVRLPAITDDGQA